MKNLKQKIEIEGSARPYENISLRASAPQRYFIEIDSSVISLLNTELSEAAIKAGYTVGDLFKYKITAEIEPKEKS